MDSYENVCGIFLKCDYNFYQFGNIKNIKIGDLITYKYGYQYANEYHPFYIVLIFCEKNNSKYMIIMNTSTFEYHWLSEKVLNNYNIVNK